MGCRARARPRLAGQAAGAGRYLGRVAESSPTPRIGGVAVAAGLVAAIAVSCLLNGGICPWSLLLLCAAPAFIWGLIEDVSKRGAIAVRFALTGIAAALGYTLLDARITQLHVPGLDQALAVHAVSFAFTVFAVTGVAHSINIIDGLNGLSGVIGLLAAIGIAIVAAIVGDTLVFPAACALAASVAGFLLVNYPRDLPRGWGGVSGRAAARRAGSAAGAPQLRGVALVPADSSCLPDLGDAVQRLPAQSRGGIRRRARTRCTCTRSCTGGSCAGAASRESRRTT